MTTRDPIGILSPDELLRAKVWGILTNMVYILAIPLLLACFGLLWGQIVTRGKLIARIEKYFTNMEVTDENPEKATDQGMDEEKARGA